MSKDDLKVCTLMIGENFRILTSGGRVTEQASVSKWPPSEKGQIWAAGMPGLQL